MNALQSLAMLPTANEARLARDVTAAARGDRDAYGRLVDDTRNLVTAISLAIVRDVATSEDVAQEVYLQAWQGLGRLRNPSSFLPWLRQLARNRAHDEARRRARQRSEPLADEGPRDPRPDARAQLIAVEEQAALAAALDELPDAAREVVTLYYREGCSVAQVAGLIGLSELAVKKRLSRAREVLREATLARLGETVAKSAPAAAFTAAVLGAITAGAPATAAALVGTSKAGALGSAGKAATLGGATGKAGALLLKGGGASLAVKLAGALSGVLAGAIGGSLGVVGGMRKHMRRARDDEERRALARFTVVNVALCIIGSIAMPVGNLVWPRGAGLSLGFGLMWVPLSLNYLVWLPRITARRYALERQEDPAAAARQRRERYLSWLGCLCGTIAGWGTVIFATLKFMPR